MQKRNIVVLISGSGSNLQSIIDATNDESFPGKVVAVISNKPDAFGLQRARDAGIETVSLDHKTFTDRAAFDQALKQTILPFQPDIVVLAGFMRILTPEFVQTFEGKMLNIHPSLLPLYPGLHTHQRAIDAGDKEHGVTVHFVTCELDGGPAIVQARVPIQGHDTETSLAKRVLAQEHQIYPLAIKWFLDGSLTYRDGFSVLNGDVLPSGGLQYTGHEG